MSSKRTSPASIAASATFDVVLVVVFVLIGRRNHEEGFTLLGTAMTLWPFLAGLAIGWLAMRAWRSPTRVVWTGIGIWVATVAGGMALRAVSGQGTAISFVVVATLLLGTGLLGWRALTLLALRRKTVTA